MLCAIPSRRMMLRSVLHIFARTDASKGLEATSQSPKSYADGRPSATLRFECNRLWSIIRHGQGPEKCDYLGAREAICFRAWATLITCTTMALGRRVGELVWP